MSYTGPGDIVASAKSFWGLRAYTNASIGGNCIDVKRASDNTTNTFVTVAGGLVDVASITTFLAATTGTVTKAYDQTGNGFHLITDGVHALPIMGLSVLGAMPAMQSGGGFQRSLVVSSFTQAQPFTISHV